MNDIFSRLETHVLYLLLSPSIFFYLLLNIERYA